MAILLDPGMIIVLILRLFGPLMIFRWPLAGTLLSQYVFDMFDVVIWDAMGTLKHINYTAFDKPLDLYQLTIQFLVCLKWGSRTPRNWAVGLYLYRLIGFVLYEFTHQRVIFLIFPNFFFVFFLFYLIALKMKKQHWFEDKSKLFLILLIIFVIKIPQEYALHYLEVTPWKFLKSVFLK